jgi:dihydrofolate reductase
MAKLIYGMGPISLDGYVSDRNGDFSWVTVGEDLHLHAGAELTSAGTLIYGRKMYDLMVFWETADQQRDLRAASVTFARSWRMPEKLVVSRTLTEATSKRTRIVPSLSLDEMTTLKAESTKPVTIAGPTTASPFLNAGLVDEVTCYVLPFVLGGGLPFFKDVDHLIRMEQIEECPLDGGYTFRRYAVRN